MQEMFGLKKLPQVTVADLNEMMQEFTDYNTDQMTKTKASSLDFARVLLIVKPETTQYDNDRWIKMGSVVLEVVAQYYARATYSKALVMLGMLDKPKRVVEYHTTELPLTLKHLFKQVKREELAQLRDQVF